MCRLPEKLKIFEVLLCRILKWDVYLAGHVVGCEIKVINASVPAVASIALVSRNRAHGGGMLEVVTRLGEETIHFEPLDNGVVVAAIGGIYCHPEEVNIFWQKVNSPYLAFLTFSIG